MMNEFRRHPKIAGWLYTEHHDVINEWNGYYRFDRSEKFTGLDAFVPGMTMADLHHPFYLSTGSDLCRDVKPGETIEVPLFASFLTDRTPGRNLVIRSELYGWNTLGQRESYQRAARTMGFAPWMARELPPLRLTMPARPALVVLGEMLSQAGGVELDLPGRRGERVFLRVLIELDEAGRDLLPVRVRRDHVVAFLIELVPADQVCHPRALVAGQDEFRDRLSARVLLEQSQTLRDLAHDLIVAERLAERLHTL